MDKKSVIAVCGKGGVGKTVVSALLSRALSDAGAYPLLLIDADPAGGLASAIGERSFQTMASVRDRLIASAKSGKKSDTAAICDQVDYLVFETLLEREKYSLLAMGHSAEKGCFCPANNLLRGAIDLISASFIVTLIDAEAGIEQIKRDVTKSVNRILVVVDGSQRSIATLRLIADLVDGEQVCAIGNRIEADEIDSVIEGIQIIGTIPQDQTVLAYDRKGRSLWELPAENEALNKAKRIAGALFGATVK
ncbi:MAG: AAA family ATPase [Desulfatitalea sp.]|nr:AAA family ATPase [Desulfatitalea sp.]NNK00382.1 AAA family ATPase [Desulfatitalea sp.]